MHLVQIYDGTLLNLENVIEIKRDQRGYLSLKFGDQTTFSVASNHPQAEALWQYLERQVQHDFRTEAGA